MHEVIALHQPQEKCSSKIWQSKVVVFRPLHQIETKQDECEEEASLLNLEFNREGKAQCHILNKMIKKIILIKKIWYGGNCTSRTRCSAPVIALGNSYTCNTIVYSCTEKDIRATNINKTEKRYPKKLYFAKTDKDHLDLVLNTSEERVESER